MPWLADGAVHGRGACDMKAGVVAVARRAGRRPDGGGRAWSGRSRCTASIGEEDGGLGAWATLQRGHRGDVCVIPEPTAQAVVTANAGALTFRLEVAGRAAHAAIRDQGVSAVEVFADVHAELREFEAERQKDADPRFGEAPYPYGLSIGRVQAGDWASSVPDRLVAEGRYGVRLGEPVATARAAFEERLAAICARHPWLAEHPVRLTWIGGAFASGELPAGHAAAAGHARGGGRRRRRDACRSGRSPRAATCASTPRRASRPCTTGRATSHLAHGPRERVPVAEVVTAARAFALLTLRTCGVR